MLQNAKGAEGPMNLRKLNVLFGVLGIAFLLSACSDNTENAEIVESSETLVESIVESEMESEGEMETTEPETEEQEVFVEDTNIYGNTMGNLYNDGVYVEAEDGSFIMRTRWGQMYSVDSEENGNYMENVNAYSLNYADGKIYGISLHEKEEYNGILMICNMEEERFLMYAEKKTTAVYLVNGVLYYVDANTNNLICFDPETEEETLLIDKAVYYPCFYKDVIIFQLDEDGESLYSIPITGGEMTKLNDMHSHWPLVYKDKIYYQGVEDASYTLRCMNLDGSDDTELAAVRYNNPVLCEDKLCFVDVNNPKFILFLDLSNPDMGIQTLDFGEELIELLKNYDDTFDGYKMIEVSNLAYLNGSLVFWTLYSADEGNMIGDAGKYNFENEKLELAPIFSNSEDSEKTEEYTEGNATAESNASQSSPDNTGHNYYKGLTAEQAAAGDAIAKQIADSVMANSAYTTDLQRVNAAAQIVQGYCKNELYGADANKYYRSPYGVFVTGNWTCAGATRAMGRVLDFMGYSWTHVNENQWAHQWCVLTMDGQIGFAEGTCGCAKYGDWNDYFWTDGNAVYPK